MLTKKSLKSLDLKEQPHFLYLSGTLIILYFDKSEYKMDYSKIQKDSSNAIKM